ncbi:MAG TPA: NAD(P)-dependent alcohol dehydrogenase [Candidatus Limnocylindria bacterium]|jgi:NADPH:quinone reductase-like Zn-dependent oxidoreductase
MKAIVSTQYGSPDVMKLGEVDKPEVADDAVLVRVRATSVNPHDWHSLRGEPYIMRMGEGLRRPKRTVLGIDAAGVVDAVGKDVTELHPGDEVFGVRSGAFAEYVSGHNFVPKPVGLTFEQAAAVPVAGLTALQGVRDKGGVQPGQRVLIYGAGGGVGSFAVQIAKALGANVTGVTSTGNVEMIRSLGADEVIDYTREDFTRRGQPYDVILDIGAKRPLLKLRRGLAPDGTLVLVGGSRGNWIGPIARALGALVMSRFANQTLRPFMSDVNTDDLLTLKELIETGKVRPVIDRTYPLSETAEAVRYLETGQARGKVVITV